jgi:hypothetical protein
MAEDLSPLSVEELAAATADRLVEAAAHFAFELFQDKKFRREARFDRLVVEEQDRIFNELLVANLTLLMLTLEAPDLRVDDEARQYLRLLQAAIPRAHITSLERLGVPAAALRDWEKLIGLRFDEYCRDRHSVRAAAMQAAADDKGLAEDDLAAIQLLLPVQTVAIGCHHHVCRSKTAGRDELFKLVLRALSRFYLETRITFEGGTITPLARIRMAVRHALNKNR